MCIRDSYLSDKHAENYNASKAAKNKLKEYPGLRRKPLRASADHPVTQKWYAEPGIITPEMEFVAIRENLGRLTAFQTVADSYPQNETKSTQASDSSLEEKIAQLEAELAETKAKLNQPSGTPEGYLMPRPSEIDPQKQVARNRMDHQLSLIHISEPTRPY